MSPDLPFQMRRSWYATRKETHNEAPTDSRGQFSATVNMGQNISKVFYLISTQSKHRNPLALRHSRSRYQQRYNRHFFSAPGFAMSGLVIDEAQRPQTNTILRIFDVESLKLIAIASPGSEATSRFSSRMMETSEMKWPLILTYTFLTTISIPS